MAPTAAATLRGLGAVSLLLLLLLQACCSAHARDSVGVEVHDLSDTGALRAKFAAWTVRHGRAATPPRGESAGEAGARPYDVEARFQVFRANAETVNRHNAAYLSGKTSFSMSLDGPFADATADEFASGRLMAPQNCSATHRSSGKLAVSDKDLPPAVDWRTTGAITPIKNQGHCGSCWTFSTTGGLEAHHCIANGLDCSSWTGLSEQQLVDCAGDYDNNGCAGGLPSHAFEYIKDSGGLDTEQAYHYKGVDEACEVDRTSATPGATLTDVFNITAYDEAEIPKAVAFVGPVSIAYQVAPDFRLYKSGVYDSYNATTGKPVCQSGPSQVNHAVVVVGYGETMEDEPEPFYIIRNSWGNTWGMEGYFWMVRGKNMCGVSDCASFPIVEKGEMLSPQEIIQPSASRKEMMW